MKWSPTNACWGLCTRGQGKAGCRCFCATQIRSWRKKNGTRNLSFRRSKQVVQQWYVCYQKANKIVLLLGWGRQLWKLARGQRSFFHRIVCFIISLWKTTIMQRAPPMHQETIKTFWGMPRALLFILSSPAWWRRDDVMTRGVRGMPRDTIGEHAWPWGLRLQIFVLLSYMNAYHNCFKQTIPTHTSIKTITLLLTWVPLSLVLKLGEVILDETFF